MTSSLVADRSEAAERPLRGKLSTPTRRDFVRGIAAAGASTAGAVALKGTGLDLFAEQAFAHGRSSRFGHFEAIAASSGDALEVPEGFRAQVLISWGDAFRDRKGRTLRYGFNNDFLAYFPLERRGEGLLFVNHEYPDPFFLYGYKPDGAAKTAAQVQLEKDAVGNSILHVRRSRSGRWKVVSPSPYNRRIYGDRPALEFTGPLAGARGDRHHGQRLARQLLGRRDAVGHRALLRGELRRLRARRRGRCLGRLRVEAVRGGAEDAEYDAEAFKKYGWVCEHDPYDPGHVGRKHTALGRFRHENTAFRHEPGKRFVLYMGDDKANEGVYKFVSDRRLRKRDRDGNRRILESGTLYVARWEPEGRRRFTTAGDTQPISATEGRGIWVPVPKAALDDTATKLREHFGDEYDEHFATNRPEDLEVAADGSVYIALTNNSTVNDSHGSVRRLRERGNDPEALAFSWRDYAAGGPTGGEAGSEGFSSPDNLVFDGAGNLWVVTDISSSRLNGDNEYGYHKNNAMFMVPTSGPNKGVAFRFANGPVHCELTGPYFTPDEQTLFVNVQHPGEQTGNASDSAGVFGQEQTYTSWWPEGDRSRGDNPATPKPSTVAITRESRKRR